MEKLTYYLPSYQPFLNECLVFFRGKHQLTFIWFILIIALGVGDYKLTTMAYYGSNFITEDNGHFPRQQAKRMIA